MQRDLPVGGKSGPSISSSDSVPESWSSSAYKFKRIKIITHFELIIVEVGGRKERTHHFSVLFEFWKGIFLNAKRVIKFGVMVSNWENFEIFGVVVVAKMAIARHIPLFWNSQAAIFHIVMTFSEVKNTKRFFGIIYTNLIHEIIFANWMRSQFVGQKFEHIIFTRASRSWRLGRHFDGLFFENVN